MALKIQCVLASAANSPTYLDAVSSSTLERALHQAEPDRFSREPPLKRKAPGCSAAINRR
jgi:hypothetical protein